MIFMSDYTAILTKAEDGVATIWLNRPEHRNAFSTEMREELYAALTAGGRLLACVPAPGRSAGRAVPAAISRRTYSITASMTRLACRRVFDAATSRAPSPITAVRIAA